MCRCTGIRCSLVTALVYRCARTQIYRYMTGNDSQMTYNITGVVSQETYHIAGVVYKEACYCGGLVQ